MWSDHRKLAGPSVYPARITEIIWQIYRIAFIAMSVMAISIARYASRNSPKGIVPLDVEIGEAALLALSR